MKRILLVLTVATLMAALSAVPALAQSVDGRELGDCIGVDDIEADEDGQVVVFDCLEESDLPRGVRGDHWGF